MMREQVIVTQVRITKAGQANHFQVRLPKNTNCIIGIETGLRLIKKQKALPEEPLRLLIPYKRNTLIGELKLQSCEEANIFYATHILSDENLAAGDYSLKGRWTASSFTHQNKTEEDMVIVDGDSTIVQGLFKDRIGEITNMDVEYVVSVYVWVAINDPIETKGANT